MLIGVVSPFAIDSYYRHAGLKVYMSACPLVYFSTGPLVRIVYMNTVVHGFGFDPKIKPKPEIRPKILILNPFYLERQIQKWKKNFHILSIKPIHR